MRPVLANSGVIAGGLIGRVDPRAPSPHCDRATGCEPHWELPDPTIVTPVAGHWLHDVNYTLAQNLVEVANAQNLVNTWIGIVTPEEMARCLGWPNREIGFADVVALRTGPRGWQSCPGARPEWGQVPRIVYTDPNSSTTGKSVLFTLHAIAAGKPPEQVTLGDVGSVRVSGYMERFWSALDHIEPDTLVANQCILRGQECGHFFFAAEDNLAKLYLGKIRECCGQSGAAPAPNGDDLSQGGLHRFLPSKRDGDLPCTVVHDLLPFLIDRVVLDG